MGDDAGCPSVNLACAIETDVSGPQVFERRADLLCNVLDCSSKHAVTLGGDPSIAVPAHERHEEMGASLGLTLLPLIPQRSACVCEVC